MKVYPMASKKGMPKFSLNYNNLSTFDVEDLEDYADYVEVREDLHRKRNLYGKGGPDYRPHGDTKAKTQEHVDFRQRILSYQDYVDIFTKRWACIYDPSEDAQPNFSFYPYVLPKLGIKL